MKLNSECADSGPIKPAERCFGGVGIREKKKYSQRPEHGTAPRTDAKPGAAKNQSAAISGDLAPER